MAIAHEVYIYAKDKMKQGHLLYDRRTNTFFVYHSTPTPQFINLMNEDTNNVWLFSKLRVHSAITTMRKCFYYGRDNSKSTLRVYDDLCVMEEAWEMREAA